MKKLQTKHSNKRAHYSAFLRLAPSFCTLVRNSLQNNLQSAVKVGTLSTQSQKTTAEPQNSNDKSTAHGTPQACFFMRGLHTPKERPESLELQERLSMVACNGKGFALCCVPLIAVSEPVTRYRPKPQNFQAVTLKSIINGVTQMYQFIFAAIRRTDLTNHIQKIRITADSEQQARAILAREFVLILAGKINLKNDRTFSPEQNHSLQSSVMMGSICGTTTNEGNRNPYLCGIFLSQIPFKGLLRPKNIEFAVRATPRNKALCTNKGGYSFVAVEPLSHPLKGDNSLLTKQTRQFKMTTFQTLSGNTAQTVSIAFTSNRTEVVYA